MMVGIPPSLIPFFGDTAAFVVHIIGTDEQPHPPKGGGNKPPADDTQPQPQPPHNEKPPSKTGGKGGKSSKGKGGKGGSR